MYSTEFPKEPDGSLRNQTIAWCVFLRVGGNERKSKFRTISNFRAAPKRKTIWQPLVYAIVNISPHNKYRRDWLPFSPARVLPHCKTIRNGPFFRSPIFCIPIFRPEIVFNWKTLNEMTAKPSITSRHQKQFKSVVNNSHRIIRPTRTKYRMFYSKQFNFTARARWYS